MLELRKAAVHAGGVPGDPVRPLSCAKEQKLLDRMQATAHSKQDSLRPPKAHPPLSEAGGKPVLPNPLGEADGQAPKACCPFSHGIPVAVTSTAPHSDFAVIPLCYPTEVASTAAGESSMHRASLQKEASPTEQQKQATRILHAYVEEQQHHGSCAEGFQRQQATLSDTALGELADARRPAASLEPKVANSDQKPASGAQTPSIRPQTQQEMPSHQQLQIKQQNLQKDAGVSQEEAATATMVQHQPSEHTGAVKVPADVQLQPRPHSCVNADSSPQQQLEHPADFSSFPEGSSKNGSSSPLPAVRSQIPSGSDSLDAVAFSGDLGGHAAPSAPIDGTTLLRDLQQIQSKKKVLFTPGPGSRGSPAGENPFEADDDSIFDLS
ncbi:hypothetical protein EPH_0008310 [Eimeria praecox]|uniref:Uncharacterized protein n=1 Tax=Eimeria praecox TaxID=51316 RepID=U6GKP2_9EIME|nr:hypothetical protein EPH_0008310 [Eimeria praecox]